MKKESNRQFALRHGDVTYYGKPCFDCGDTTDSERYTSTRNCVKCANKSWRKPSKAGQRKAAIASRLRMRKWRAKRKAMATQAADTMAALEGLFE